MDTKKHIYTRQDLTELAQAYKTIEGVRNRIETDFHELERFDDEILSALGDLIDSLKSNPNL